MNAFLCSRLSFLAIIYLFGSAAAAELPRGSQELIEKLEAFEKSEKEKLENLLTEKREAVVKLLEQQAATKHAKEMLMGPLLSGRKSLLWVEIPPPKK